MKYAWMILENNLAYGAEEAKTKNKGPSSTSNSWTLLHLYHHRQEALHYWKSFPSVTTYKQ